MITDIERRNMFHQWLRDCSHSRLKAPQFSPSMTPPKSSFLTTEQECRISLAASGSKDSSIYHISRFPQPRCRLRLLTCRCSMHPARWNCHYQSKSAATLDVWGWQDLCHPGAALVREPAAYMYVAIGKSQLVIGKLGRPFEKTPRTDRAH